MIKLRQCLSDNAWSGQLRVVINGNDHLTLYNVSSITTSTSLPSENHASASGCRLSRSKYSSLLNAICFCLRFWMVFEQEKTEITEELLCFLRYLLFIA